MTFIAGIIGKLGHLKEMGVTGTWLSPIFTSPMVDFGYDIADFFNVDPTFGTMSDLEELFRKAAELDIKVILDFVPNHSSDRCDWFVKSIAKDGEFTDYYIWHDGTPPAVPGQRPGLPNNWVSSACVHGVFGAYYNFLFTQNSVFYGPAWTWNEQRQQYYFHQFAKEQPDLNYRNPLVVEQMKNVLRFWLGKGAAGFRVDAINHLFEVEDFRNEPLNPWDTDPLSYGYTDKDYTKDLDETYDMIYQWRAVMDTFTQANGTYTRIMMSEAYANTTKTMEYYQSRDGTRQGAHMPFNFVLINELNEHSSASDFLNVIQTRWNAIPTGRVTNWVIGNHDQPRVGSRYGTQRIDAMLMLVMTLPGIAVTYQGEEIGMVDNRDGISFEDTKDPQGINVGPEKYKWASRDPVRTPFQWDNTPMTGFTSGSSTWLPIHPNSVWLNLADQKKARRSTYHYYQELMKLRENHILIDGSFEPKIVNGDVLTYVRTLEGHGTMVVLINFASVEQVVKISDITNVFAGETRVEVVVAGADSMYSAG